MSGPNFVLIRLADLPSRVRTLSSDTDDTKQVAIAVRRYLSETQPVLFQQLKVGIDGNDVAILIAPNAPAGTRLGVEAALGLESRQPDFELPPDVKEVEVDPAAFSVVVSDTVPETLIPEGLSSTVRLLPVPIAEWFEICEGSLSLDQYAIRFETQYEILSDTGATGVSGHRYDLSAVQAYGIDLWWNVPCLRIVTDLYSYRYGWTANFVEMGMEFDIDEWIAFLGRLCPQAERKTFDA